MGEQNYNYLAGQKVSRIEALTDGIFAVAMTLLILDIKVPVAEFHSEMDLINAFVPLLPKFLTYLLGFMTLGIFWVGHSTQFKFIKTADRHLTWISIFFWMFAAIIPFSTAFLSEHIHFKFAVGFYWLNIFLLGMILFIHWIYARRKNLLDEAVSETVFKTVRNRITTAQTLYLIAALCCFINTYLSVALIILIQLNYALAFFFNSNWKKPEAEAAE